MTTPHSRLPTPAVVVLTGSESAGKTTLAARLAETYGAPWAPEFARRYLDAKWGRTQTPLDASDVEPIARGQLALADDALREAARRGARVVFLDTDLTSTAVYARYYYGHCPAWIERAARDRRAHLYLLCHPDVLWVADPPQRDRPHDREHLHSLFVATLAELGAAWVDVRGGWEERERRAREAVEALL